MPDGNLSIGFMPARGEGYKGGAPTPFVNSFYKTAVGSLRYNTSQMGQPLPIIYGTQRAGINILEFWGYQTTSGKGGKGGGGKGSGGKGKSSTPTSSVYTAMGLCQGPVSPTGRMWSNAGIAFGGPGAVGLNFFAGNDGQAADGTFEALDPNRPVLGYSGTAYMTGDPLQLGESTAVPNTSAEITGFEAGTIGASFPADARADLIILDFLTNARYGAGFASANVDSAGTFSDFGTYCQATGLAMSLFLDRCQPAARWVEEVCQLTVAAPFWTGALLKIVPYATHTYSNFGATWTPDLTVRYSVADRDLLDFGGDTDPVVITRSDPTQATNWFGLEYYDSSNSYNPNIAYAFDQGAIDAYGLRNEPVGEGHAFTNATSASASAQLQLQRKQLILNNYKFRLGWVFALLDPMDIIEITDARAGLNATPVRIREIEEDENGELTFTAEELPGVASSVPQFAMSVPTSQVPQANIDPGPINAPIIFGMPVSISGNQGLTLGIALSGSKPDVWGGCLVYVSTDGETYARLDQPQGTATRMGVLTADFPAGSDPDTTNSLNVDLSESAGELLTASTTDADNDITPCIIGGPNGFEWIAYSTALLTSTYNYALGGYIRRGQFSSQIVDHPTGAQFARIDATVYQVPYQADQIGKTLYFKFPSFNIFGASLENVADIPAYNVIVPAPPPPPDVTGFGAAQTGTAVTFSWNPVPYPTVALAGYDLGYAPQGTTDWNDFKIILEASNMTVHTNADIPPGSWTFGIRAASIAHITGMIDGEQPTQGLSPHITTFNLTVTNPNEIIYGTDETATRINTDQAQTIIPPSPFWGGTIGGG